ncbi:MAG: hypothetical protein K6T34_01405 [Thermoflavifilum sp.]|nr:hypothetical protein [Thermoflavifilum sp.]
MEELIEKLKQEAGLTEEQARKTLEVLWNYVSDRVPPFLQGQVKKMMGIMQNKENLGSQQTIDDVD